MVAHPQEPSMSVADYLAAESTSEIKHEYVYGHVYAMAGGTLAHDLIGNNVRALLHSHLRGSPCRLLGPDSNLYINAEVYYYPDALVVCADDEDLDLADRVVHAPRLIVEVLSDSTEANDRGSKFKNYQTLESLQEYVLVDGRRRSVEIFRRHSHDLWDYQQCAPDANVRLESIGLTCPIADFYAGTRM